MYGLGDTDGLPDLGVDDTGGERVHDPADPAAGPGRTMHGILYPGNSGAHVLKRAQINRIQIRDSRKIRIRLKTLTGSESLNPSPPQKKNWTRPSRKMETRIRTEISA